MLKKVNALMTFGKANTDAAFQYGAHMTRAMHVMSSGYADMLQHSLTSATAVAMAMVGGHSLKDGAKLQKKIAHEALTALQADQNKKIGDSLLSVRDALAPIGQRYKTVMMSALRPKS